LFHGIVFIRLVMQFILIFAGGRDKVKKNMNSGDHIAGCGFSTVPGQIDQYALYKPDH